MEKYVLKLYVTGNSEASTKAVSVIKEICSEYMQDTCALEIIDIEKNPHLAAEAQILAIPTLIKEEPFPKRRLIGALTAKSRVLAGLDLI